MCQQRDDRHHQLASGAQPIERRPRSGSKSLLAFGAPITLILAAMNPDVTLADLSSSRTVRVRAKCCVRVHSFDPVLIFCWRRKGIRIGVGLSLCQKSTSPRFNGELPIRLINMKKSVKRPSDTKVLRSTFNEAWHFVL